MNAKKAKHLRRQVQEFANSKGLPVEYVKKANRKLKKYANKTKEI
jgi:hypothetical protein